MPSWLYEHRDQLDGLKPLVEIAHWAVVYHIPPEDQDDVEQEIVIKLLQTVEKRGNKGKAYLKAVARYRIYAYYRAEHQRKKLRYIDESERGEKAGGTLVFVHYSDADARLDANTTLATLPERLIHIGHKLLNGEKLSGADQAYRIKQRAKLKPGCQRCFFYLSAREERRILRLYHMGICVLKIALTMGRSETAVLRVLASHQLPPQRISPAEKIKARDNQIREAYFIEGKSIKRIAGEFRHDRRTVRKAIREGSQEKGRVAGEG